MNRSLLLIALGITLTSCMASPVSLPTSGRIYVETTIAGNTSLQPAPNVLVLVRRYESCPGNKWLLMASSTNGVDAYLVRTDASGMYSIPGRRISPSCGIFGIKAIAFRPHHAAFEANHFLKLSRYAGNPLYSKLKESDGVLMPENASPERARALADSLYSDLGGYDVNDEMRSAVRNELEPEISSYTGEAHTAWDEGCQRWSVCGTHRTDAGK